MGRCIAVSGVTLSYDGSAVVSGLTFDINDGNCLCVLGENGSGKSTLIKAIVGLITPSAGSITRENGLTRQDIGYLPQQNAAQRDFPASVTEVVQSGALAVRRGFVFTRPEDRKQAKRYMELLGISELARHSFAQLSGGQQQRVLLARALCAANRVLVLDEPVTGLDPLVTSELYRIIEEKNRKDGLTVISVSHDPVAACRTATHVLHLGEGGTRFFGTVDAYLASPLGCEYAHKDDNGEGSGSII